MSFGKLEGAIKKFPDSVPGLLYDEPLSCHTSFRIGGPADVFALPKTAEELLHIHTECTLHEIPFTILGDGTNVLVLDGGIRGVVVSTKHMDGFEVSPSGRIWAAAGVKLSKLSEAAWKNSLQGLEFASGIPGTVGGAVYMNAGAFGGEIGDFVESVTVYENGAKNLSKTDLGFGYRKSVLQELNALVLDVRLVLEKGSKDEIRSKMNELGRKRKESQPLDAFSAGSTFKRPEGGFAAELIDKSGLKGFSVGGAMVSKKHAGFIVNTGNASAKDVIGLMEIVKQKVFSDSGVVLCPEIKILGE